MPLSVLIKYCGMDSSVESRLTERFGNSLRVISASPKELMAVEGMTEKAVVFFGLVAELRRRMDNSAPLPSAYKNNTKEIERYIMRRLSCENNEKSIALLVDKKGVGRKITELGRGDANCAPVLVDELLKGKKGENAIIAHNHIEGKITPSLDDVLAAKSSEEQLSADGVKLKSKNNIYGGNDNAVVYGGESNDIIKVKKYE